MNTGMKAKPVKDSMPMNRNILYVIVAVVGIAIGILGYQLYLNHQKPSGIEIKLDDNGISIQKQ